MGDALAEGMVKGVEAMGEMMGSLMSVMAERAPTLQRLEPEHDLDTVEGIQADASDLHNVAVEKLRGIADQMDEVSRLARTDPQAALELRRTSKAVSPTP